MKWNNGKSGTKQKLPPTGDKKLLSISAFTKEKKLQFDETFKLKLNAAKDLNQLRGIEGAQKSEDMERSDIGMHHLKYYKK